MESLRIRRVLCCGAVVGSAQLLAINALCAAEPPLRPYPECKPGTADASSAKAAFRAGTIAFEESDYENAIALWEKAYQRDCTAHVLLKNLARVYELSRLYRHAIHSLTTYRARTSDQTERSHMKQRIAVLEEKLYDQRRASRAGGGTSEGTTAPAMAPNAGESTLDEAGTGSSSEPTSANEAAGSSAAEGREDAEGRPVWPLYVAGGGALVAAVAAVPLFSGHSELNDATQRCGGDRQTCVDPTAFEDGRIARAKVNRWSIVAGIGLGVAIVGATVYFLDPFDEPVAWTPVIAPGYAGLSYTGSF